MKMQLTYTKTLKLRTNNLSSIGKELKRQNNLLKSLVHQQKKMESLLLRMLEDLRHSDRYGDALLQKKAGCRSMIRSMTVHAVHHIVMSEREHVLVQRVQKKLWNYLLVSVGSAKDGGQMHTI